MKTPIHTIASPPGLAWSQEQLATSGRRFAAFVLDGLILLLGKMVVMLAMQIDHALHLDVQVGLLHVAWLLVMLAYHPYFWATRGQTPGQRVMHIKVVRSYGRPLSWSSAIARYLGYLACALPLYLGFLSILTDHNRQGFHDKIAGTVVVHAE